jgi:hypothetical protein
MHRYPIISIEDPFCRKVSGIQVQQLTQIYTITNCCLPLFALGSSPPSYIRWIPSTIIYPLDPFHHHISVGSLPQDAEMFNKLRLELEEEWEAEKEAKLIEIAETKAAAGGAKGEGEEVMVGREPVGGDATCLLQV